MKHPILLLGLIVSMPLFAADFGDAPDGSDTFYPVQSGQPTITGNFPTLSASGGANHLTLGQEWLGQAASAPDSEPDANVVNNDLHDDAFPPIPFFLTLTSLPPTAKVSFWVTVDAAAPDLPRHVNMLIDWDQSGDWKNIAGAAPEWAIQNFVVNIPPGTTQLVTVPIQWGLGAQLSPQIFWVRVTLTQSSIDPAPFGANGWDGSGSFAFGETEDFLFHPNRRHDSGTPWSPPGNPPTGWTPPPGGGASLPGISLIPKSQDVAHGKSPTVTVSLDNPTDPDPATLEWAVGAGQRGGFLFENGATKIPFGDSWTSSGSDSIATSAPGASPTLGTITINSTVHSLLSPEEWPLRVRARWPGIGTQTRKAVVRIWHSGWGGIFAIGAHYDILEAELQSLPEPYKGNAINSVGLSKIDWIAGGYVGADQLLTIVQFEVLAVFPPAPNTTEILNQISALKTAIIALGLQKPVPQMTSPVDGDTLTGTVLLEAFSTSPEVDSASFYIATSDGSDWSLIGTDNDSADDWSVSMDTTIWPDGPARLRVEMQNTDNEIGEFDTVVWIDNTVAAPTPVTPLPDANVVGIVPIEAACATDESVTGVLELLGPGGDWFEIGRTVDVEESFSTILDTGRMEAGLYTLRATTEDEQGNTNSISWDINIKPSFVAWKYIYGVSGLGPDDDINQDGLPLGVEYYLGFAPDAPDNRISDFSWTQTEGPFRFSFKPAEFLDGVRAKVETGDDLSSWSAIVTDPVADEFGEVNVDVPAGPKTFVRLNVWEDRP